MSPKRQRFVGVPEQMSYPSGKWLICDGVPLKVLVLCPWPLLPFEIIGRQPQEKQHGTCHNLPEDNK
jgi:hypothetical protein